MKKFFASVITVAVSSLLLTACSFDGNMGSKYYDVAKQQVSAAGLDGKVIAGKMTSGNDFVTIEFDDITGDEIVKAANVLASLPIPATADRRIDWKSENDSDLPHTLMFNTATPNMNQINKFAQTWEAYGDNIEWAHYNLNMGPNSSRTMQPQMTIDLKDGTSQDNFKATVNYIKSITSQPSATNTSDNKETVLFAISGDEVSLLAVKPEDDTDAAIDLAYEVNAIAEQKKSSYPNIKIKSYGVSIYHHTEEIGSDVHEFSMSFGSQTEEYGEDAARERNNYDLEISQLMFPKAQAIGY